ncbi:NrsF family protein [Methylocapsa palsarum]|uniref:DUF1109 domain-containing protein n=1 Tax=Methylocapsa palsarum TaxID=1612308 RepID=A0A1I3W432_9HYPH|nr:NrsF family protein [Methylocapsa palsarum]SFK01181.1 hypothetical protein SAMN05444581_101268 [Methylocapsa palsarum]
MRTADLIRALAADNAPRRLGPGKALALALGPGVVVAFALFLKVLGFRPHLLAMAGDPRLAFKICVSLALAALAGRLVARIARPGADARKTILWLALPAVLLAASVVAEAMSVPIADWGRKLWGANAMVCLKSIPFLAAAPLIAVLAALRNGAPDRPAAAGAAAGLLAGALGAALYAMHCPDDSPFFVAVWYTLAISLVTAAGAVAGSRLLRW